LCDQKRGSEFGGKEQIRRIFWSKFGKGVCGKITIRVTYTGEEGSTTKILGGSFSKREREGSLGTMNSDITGGAGRKGKRLRRISSKRSKGFLLKRCRVDQREILSGGGFSV